MRKITIDIETYSDIDLLKSGVYKYASSENFEILLFSYSVDGSEVQTVDLAGGEEIPQKILNALVDKNTEKWAYNANFERVCLSVFLRKNYPELYRKNATDSGFLAPSSWYCSQLSAIYLGLPLSLASVGEVLKIEQQKMSEGKRLIDYFSKPSKNGTRHLHTDSPEKWEIFKSYNRRDVEAEMAIDRKLSRFPVPKFVRDEYNLSEEINDRGIKIDMDFVEKAVMADERCRAELMTKLKNLTGLQNPNSVSQLKNWLAENGLKVDSLGKADVRELLKSDGISPKVREVLTLRQQSAKSSVKKYQAMKNAVCPDSRARGMFFFYGANRTGRFSGRLIQLQNLPQNHISDLSEARALVKSGDFDALQMLYDNIPDTLSQLVRTAFVPENGKKFIVADFSAIEARVIAWLAGEAWRIRAFANGEDIYCASASKMFGVPVVKHGINGHLRQKGKVAELACIAEGQLVLTNHGLVPIEKVTTDDMLWDGENWVHHEGVIYKGEREVITYQGLTATPDHLVFSGNRFIEFGKIAGNSAKNSGLQRVYDIKNAGQNHCFTASGKLVHNCGYGGSVGAMKAMGGSDLNLSDDELKQLVTDWRAASPNIVKLWRDVDKAVKKAVQKKEITTTHGLKIGCKSGFLFIGLPSGRSLAYVKPRIEMNRFGGQSVTYEGVGATKKWERIESYGPKFVENITQAIARDLLLNSMKTLSNCRIVAHVHDELIIECDKNVTVQEICEKMAQVPDWAEGLKLRAKYKFYRKY